MKFRKHRIGKNPKQNFYLALAFLVWSILPHFHMEVHSHAGGKGAHSHLTLSSAEVSLANRMLEALGPGGIPKQNGVEFGLDEAASSASSVGSQNPPMGSGESAVTAAGQGNRHSHYWEDANFAGINSQVLVGLLVVLAIAYTLRRQPPPLLLRFGSAWPRGPPQITLG